MKTKLDDLNKLEVYSNCPRQFGLAPASPACWANRKSRWRRRCRKLLRALDDLVARSNKGYHIPMGDIYVMARELVDLGRRGLMLRSDMPVMSTPEAPLRSLGAYCGMLESGSLVLRAVAERQNTPLIDFPVFVNRFEPNEKAEVDMGALGALHEMMKGIET